MKTDYGSTMTVLWLYFVVLVVGIMQKSFANPDPTTKTGSDSQAHLTGPVGG